MSVLPPAHIKFVVTVIFLLVAIIIFVLVTITNCTRGLVVATNKAKKQKLAAGLSALEPIDLVMYSKPEFPQLDV